MAFSDSEAPAQEAAAPEMAEPGAADVPARAFAVELVLEVLAQDQRAADAAEMQLVRNAARPRRTPSLG